MISLDFNYSHMHNSSSCVACGGELLFAIAGERISNIKHDAGSRHKAIWACLEFAKVSPDDFDFICHTGRCPAKCLLRT
jgi:predicted NodU family carbamoyl transferase